MHKTAEMFLIQSLRHRASIVIIVGRGSQLALTSRGLHRSGRPVKLATWKDTWVHVALASWIHREVSDSDVSFVPELLSQGAPARATAATGRLGKSPSVAWQKPRAQAGSLVSEQQSKEGENHRWCKVGSVCLDSHG